MRADPGDDLARPVLPHLRHGARDHPGCDSLAAGVDSRDHPGPRVGEDHRNTVGCPHEQHDVVTIADQSVGARPGGTRLCQRDLVPVHLTQVGQANTGGEVVEQQLQVARAGVPRVLCRAVTSEGEIEGVERRSTDPAVPVGEGQLDGAEGGAKGVQRKLLPDSYRLT